MRKQELHPRTEVINKKQKNQAKIARNQALIWLAANFPQSFDNTVLIQPLKLGIMNDILAHADKAAEAGISKSKLREAVVIFTRRIDYLTCLKAREMRVDLDGNPVTTVTEEEANHAALKIKKRVEKSTRNARKSPVTKSQSSSPLKTNESSKSEAPVLPNFPEYPPAYSVQNSAQPAKTASVIIKHKSSRAFDPDAVARLKEKLGLSLQRDLSKETT